MKEASIMKLSRAPFVAAAVMFCAAGVSQASITPVAEFTGDRQEGFEHVLGGGQNLPVFINTATWSGNLAPPVIATSDTNIPAQITVLPFDGNLMGLMPVGSSKFVFTTPVYAAGGYMNSVGRTVAGNPFDLSNLNSIAVFRDASNTVIDTLHFGLHVNSWAWFGWSSTTPISSVEFTAENLDFPNGPPGEAMMFDDMQLSSTPVPEPTVASALVLVAGGIGIARRRK
jgi:hypothetical protein